MNYICDSIHCCCVNNHSWFTDFNKKKMFMQTVFWGVQRFSAGLRYERANGIKSKFI